MQFILINCMIQLAKMIILKVMYQYLTEGGLIVMVFKVKKKANIRNRFN